MEITLVSVGEEMHTGLSVHKLNRDFHTFAVELLASFYQITSSQNGSYLSHVLRIIAKLEAGVSSDDAELWKPGQFRDDPFAERIVQIPLVRLRAEIIQR